MRTEVKTAVAKVMGNAERLQECPRHRFQPGLKATLRCEACNGYMDITAALAYVRGYVAHGGDPRDIIPDWTTPKEGDHADSQ